MGHALLAPAGVIVIDEPEIHLHESIQTLLWNVIEAERPDCTFVYITHDLEFAASRVSATKVALFDYVAPTKSGEWGTWVWDIVSPSEELPEDIVLRILGSRRPTLFVEGRKGGLDQKIYEAIYPDYYIIPIGGWDMVDRSVRAFRNHTQDHRLDVVGVIDRDDRDALEVNSLSVRGVYVLPVACVELLLVVSEALVAYAKTLKRPSAEQEEAVKCAKTEVIKILEENKASVIAQRTEYAVRRKLQAVSRSDDTKESLQRAVDELYHNVNVDGAFEEAETTIEKALAASSLEVQYEDVIKLLRHKAVIGNVAAAFQTTYQSYVDKVIEIVRDDSYGLREMLRDRINIPC